MPTVQPSPVALPLRHDTILGVCEALGEDFGFNPNWLRIAFAVPFYFSPVGVIGVYLALGAAVALSRWLAPDAIDAAATVYVEAEPLALAA